MRFCSLRVAPNCTAPSWKAGMIQIGTDFTWSPPRSSSAWMILRILSIPPAGNPEDVDLTLYGLRKWAALACKGNPSVLHFFSKPVAGPRIFIHVWLGIAIVVAIPSLIGSMRDLLHGESLTQGNVGLRFIVPLVFVSWGLLLPRIGAALSFHERKHVAGL
jgi:hypothetical protein